MQTIPGVLKQTAHKNPDLPAIVEWYDHQLSRFTTSGFKSRGGLASQRIEQRR